MTQDKPWQDREALRELYIDRRKSQQKIADHFGGITQAGIGYWLDKHDIEKRSRDESARLRWLREIPSVMTDTTLGYEVCRENRDEGPRTLYIHRLLAVAEHGFEAVKDNVVHHKNGIGWDNRPGNIELMSRAEHASHHHQEEVLGEE